MSGGALLPAATPFPSQLYVSKAIVDLKCKGTETRLTQCDYMLDAPCTGDKAMAISCTGGRPRSAESSLKCSPFPPSATIAPTALPCIPAPATQPLPLSASAWLMARHPTLAGWKSRWAPRAASACPLPLLVSRARPRKPPAHHPAAPRGARRRSTAAGAPCARVFLPRTRPTRPAASSCSPAVP